MAYTVKQLAKLSGVSVRTLHFYDEIGLVKPAYVGENKYRFYDTEQLFLLQQVLFYKELGFPLEEIQRILSDPKFDKVGALKAHRSILIKGVARTKKLVETIDKTIESLGRGKKMKDQEMYLGFDPHKQKEYEKEILKKGGEKAEELVKISHERIKNWEKSDFDKVKREYDEIHKALTQALIQKRSADSAEVQEIISRHFKVVSRFYDPTKEIYSGLGQLYIDHGDFRKLYDSYHPRLAEFMAEAMKIFAHAL